MLICSFYLSTHDSDPNVVFLLHFIFVFIVYFSLCKRIYYPISLFTLIYNLYYTSFYFLCKYQLINDFGYAGFVLFLHSIGYISFIIPLITSKELNLDCFKFQLNPSFLIVIKYGLILLGVLTILLITASLYTGSYKGVGYTHGILKTDAPNNYFIIGLSIYFCHFYLTKQYNIFSKVNFYLACAFIFVILTVLVLGKRVPISFFLILVFFLHQIKHKNLGPVPLFLIFLFGLVGFSFLKSISAVLQTGTIGNFLFDPLYILYGEVKTSGRMTIPIIDIYNSNFQYGYYWINTLFKGLIPNFLVSNALSSDWPIMKAEHWWYPNGASVGLGYSMVAEGYVELGSTGVFLNFTLIGLFIRFMHARCFYSIPSLILYISAVFVVSARIRHGVPAVFSFYIWSFFTAFVLYNVVSNVIFKTKVYSK